MNNILTYGENFVQVLSKKIIDICIIFEGRGSTEPGKLPQDLGINKVGIAAVIISQQNYIGALQEYD